MGAARPSGAANALFLAGLACACVVLLVRGLPLLRQVNLRTLAALLLVVTASALLGHQVGGPRHEDRVAVGIAAVFGNPALALAIAKESFSSTPALPIIAAFLLLRTLALLPYLRWARAQVGQ